MLKNYLMVFFISMVPVIELRGAIPIGLVCPQIRENELRAFLGVVFLI